MQCLVASLGGRGAGLPSTVDSLADMLLNPTGKVLGLWANSRWLLQHSDKSARRHAASYAAFF